MIRAYRPDDLETLQEITVVCFDGVSIDQNIEAKFGRFGDRDWQVRKAEHIREDAATNPEGIWVYEDQGTIAGFITTRVDHDSKIGHIPNMSVLPAYRGRGVGKVLLAAALDEFERQGMTAARIETLEQNDIGQSFYPRAGFQEVARQIHYAMVLKDRKL